MGNWLSRFSEAYFYLFVFVSYDCLPPQSLGFFLLSHAKLYTMTDRVGRSVNNIIHSFHLCYMTQSIALMCTPHTQNKHFNIDIFYFLFTCKPSSHTHALYHLLHYAHEFIDFHLILFLFFSLLFAVVSFSFIHSFRVCVCIMISFCRYPDIYADTH